MVVWCWCGGARQPVRRGGKAADDLVADLAGVCLEDAALIEHNAIEAAGIEMRELLGLLARIAAARAEADKLEKATKKAARTRRRKTASAT